MREIWDDSCKYSIWLEIEVLACEAMAELGLIPEADAQAIRARGKFSVPEILEIEKRTNHDVIAFLENVASYIGPEARWMHQGLTSSDVLDTALAVQLVRSCDILLEDVAKLREAVGQKARQYKETPMIGRSHGIHAEPITFGLKMALMYDEFGRAEQRLEAARKEVAVGKLSGAVGTHAHLDPKVEASRLRETRVKGRSVVDPGCPARPTRAVQCKSRCRRFQYGSMGNGVQTFAANRGAGVGGVFQPGTEGKFSHAAQEKSDHR